MSRHLQVGGQIARGGMGAIFEVRDTVLDRRMAMKVCHDRPESFLDEARITGQLEHPNIVPIHEAGSGPDGKPFFTMKLVEGITLARAIEDGWDDLQPGDPAALPRYLEVLLKVGDGVAFAHSRGVIHRDLKPDNIMIGRFGEVLVMDWGIASVRGAMQEGAVAGTPKYMPPEQAAGEKENVGPRSDVYGLGGILYAILTGEPPIDVPEGASTINVLKRVLGGEITPPSQRTPGRAIPPELEAISLKALALKPNDRYADVAALQQDLRLYLDGRSVSAHADSLGRALLKLVRRNRAVAAVSAAAALLLLGLGGFSYWRVLLEKRDALAARDVAQSARAEAEDALSKQRAAEEARAASEARRIGLLGLRDRVNTLLLRAQQTGSRADTLLPEFDRALADAVDDESRRLVLLGKARALSTYGRNQEAKAILRELRAQRPADREIRRALLDALIADFSVMTKEVSRFLREYAAAEPESGVAIFLRAAEAAPGERLSLYDQALERDSRLSLAHLGRSYHLLQEHLDPRSVIEECTRALEISPKFAKAYGNRGMAYSELFRLDQAQADFERALTYGPGLAYVYRERGRLFADRGARAECLVDLQKAVQLDPRDLAAWRHLIRYAKSYGDPRWRQFLSELAKLDPERAAAIEDELNRPATPAHSPKAVELNNEGYRLRQADRPQEALERFRLAVAEEPTFLIALLNAGDTAIQLKQWDEALRHARQARKVAPGDFRPHYQLGQVAQRQGRFQDAAGHFAQATAVAGSDLQRAEMLTQEAVCHLELEERAKTRELLQRSLHLWPTLGMAHCVLGILEEREGNLDAALEHYHRAVANGQGRGWFNRGLLLLQLKRYEEAERDLTEALTRYPQAKETIQAKLRVLRVLLGRG